MVYCSISLGTTYVVPFSTLHLESVFFPQGQLARMFLYLMSQIKKTWNVNRKTRPLNCSRGIYSWSTPYFWTLRNIHSLEQIISFQLTTINNGFCNKTFICQYINYSRYTFCSWKEYFYSICSCKKTFNQFMELFYILFLRFIVASFCNIEPLKSPKFCYMTTIMFFTLSTFFNTTCSESCQTPPIGHFHYWS